MPGVLKFLKSRFVYVFFFPMLHLSHFSNNRSKVVLVAVIITMIVYAGYVSHIFNNPSPKQKKRNE